MSSPFVPDCVVRHLSSIKGDLVPHCSGRHASAVALIDASGFTALSERMANLGQRGIEEMGTVMNNFFDPIIQCVSKHHGDVIKFAGDAVICLFTIEDDEVDDEEEEEVGDEEDDQENGEAQHEMQKKYEKRKHDQFIVTSRACQCATEVQQISTSFSVEAMGQVVKLSVHIAISVGKIFHLHLGGINGRWEFCLAGKPLAEMGHAIDAAAAGETVVTAEAGRL